MVRANDLIRRRRPGIVRSPALRRPAFIWLKDISIGFRSGEYLGRNRSVAPRASMACRTPAALCRKIVEHHDVVALESRGETALDVGQEAPSVPCPVDCTWCRHAILAQSGNDGDRLPMTVWLKIHQPLAACATAVKPHHLGVGGRVSRPEEFHPLPLA